MSAIASLWLPILVTAVLIFIASSLIHMVLKWHNPDYKILSNEDEVRAAIRNGSPGPGQYVVPGCKDMKDMAKEEMQKKFIEGPIAFMTIRKNGPPSMGPCLTQWFIYSVFIAAITGCLAAGAIGFGADKGHAAGHLVGMASFLAYVGGSVQMGIWMGKPWVSVLKDGLDGLIYGVISAVVFMSMWPVA